MAERVQVVVEAKDAASGVLRGITGQLGALGSVVEELTAQNVNWGNVAATTTALVIDGVKKAVNETVKYNIEMHNLSLATGTGIEATSRLVQVLDDFGVTSDDVLVATKALTRQGLAPTIETLADLSDQYIKLNGAQEKNDFIIKNLGKSGLAWAEALSKGGDALLAMNTAVDQGLIATDASYNSAVRYTIALDNWHESIEKLEYSMTPLIDALTAVINYTNDTTRAAELAEEKWGNLKYLHQLAWPELMKTAAAERELADASRIAAQGTEAAGDAAATAVPQYASLLSMTEKLNAASLKSIQMSAYQDLKQKLSEGGITQEEAVLLDQAGVALGVFDQNAVNAARSIDTLTSALASGNVTLSEFLAKINAIPTQIDTTITTHYETVGDAPPTTITQNGVPYATGTDGFQTVPPGYPNDTYPIRLSSGEQFAVIPADQPNMGSLGSQINNIYGPTTLVIASEGNGGWLEQR